MPNRLWILVGLDGADGNNFKFSQFHFAIKAESNWIDLSGFRASGTSATRKQTGTSRTRTMINLNIVPAKPVFVEVKRKAAEHDDQSDQGPLFLAHRRYS